VKDALLYWNGIRWVGRRRDFRATRFFYGGQSAVRGGVHGVHEGKDQDQERKAAGGGEGRGQEKSDAALIHE